MIVTKAINYTYVYTTNNVCIPKIINQVKFTNNSIIDNSQHHDIIIHMKEMVYCMHASDTYLIPIHSWYKFSLNK